MPRPHFDFERQLYATGESGVAGIDEAGRGPLAGPVVAAAVILAPDSAWSRSRLLNDSKLVPETMREKLHARLVADLVHVRWAVAIVETEEIDRLNILRATHEAMRRALTALVGPPATHALIDGLPVRPFPLPHTALVKGDARSLSIAAASILAKVTRDRWMREADARWPEYGFAQHKGYATAGHLAKLFAHGPCPIHRRSFEPVAQRLLPLEEA